MLKNIPLIKYLNSLKMSHVIISACYLTFIFFLYLQQHITVGCKKDPNYYNCIDISGDTFIVFFALWVLIFCILLLCFIVEIGIKIYKKYSKNHAKITEENKEKNINQDRITTRSSSFEKIIEYAYTIYYLVGLLLAFAALIIPMAATVFYAIISD